MSKYRLKKDLPDGSKEGDVYVRHGQSDRYINEKLYKEQRGIDETISLFKWQVEQNQEWFSEIKEPERIEVTHFQFHDLFKSRSDYSSFWYQFCSTQLIPIEKVQQVKQAIENVLNEPELRSKIDFKKTGSGSYDAPPLSRYLQDEAGQWGEGKPLKFAQPKKYTQKDMEDCFDQSRLTHPMVGFKHDSFKDYLQSINK